MLELDAPGVTARVDPGDGGRLTSLRVGGRELISGAAPGRAGPVGILHGSFPMAPFAGRLPQGRFSFGGATFELPRTLDGDAIHGLVYDVPWRPCGPGELSAELDGRWPFGGSVHQRFDLGTDALTVTLTIRNDERPMPAVAGFHPWFSRAVAGKPARLVFVPALRQWDAGFSDDLGPRPWDAGFRSLASVPSVSWGDLTLQVESAADDWILCETDARALCIEPLSGPIGSLGAAGCRVVRPGEPLIHTMTLRWSHSR